MAGAADTYAIAIHGGAGAVPRATLSSERERRYRAGLEAALDGGYAVLERGGASLDAVTAAVRILEDDPSFNAGRGAALSREGRPSSTPPSWTAASSAPARWPACATSRTRWSSHAA